MASFLDPAILFFIFGIFAGAVRSNLEIPQSISRFLSLYLLMALGLKGGFALHKSGFTLEIALSLGLAVFLAVLIPLIGYRILRTKLNTFDAAAIAATYGSVSAVTFITATQYLNQTNIEYGGHMAAAMALMESPAIILAIVLANKANEILSILNFILFLIPLISLCTRRLHDVGRSGWWQLIEFTGIGIIWIIVWNCLESDNATNKYGEKPVFD